ncbi:type IV secretory system conjugative DNA transfer family protein (plasmid) [Cupriavidus pinatubonensis]|uniref:type IV secretory system conjugative DNA transfer family protein n=1 Tax=Cupriavidus pinatubonensis TaxID=248026 RepID=UPI001C73827A|nr:type IV secretory system conjugative DNA transfer family protein [Cupriavidus pinatubonensis]QYY33644.1 type IV secretory system conjugative DNA transfer family protein [Cupriavidus pinatubonensis]
MAAVIACYAMKGEQMKLKLMAVLVGLAWEVAAGTAAHAQSGSENLQRLLNPTRGDQLVLLSPVRTAALRATAQAVGTQTGMIERAQEIGRVIDRRQADLDRNFRFGDLVMGQGVLPPVIIKTENARTTTKNAMRVAGAVYKISEPARFQSGSPSWRDWLLMGLPTADEMPALPTNEQLLPRDNEERKFWDQQVKAAYEDGRRQAQEIFDNNLANLKQVYIGMRTFYDLYQRGMVSLPEIARTQDIVNRDDPNTIVVGDTLFRITVNSDFVTKPDRWVPLMATPAAETRAATERAERLIRRTPQPATPSSPESPAAPDGLARYIEQLPAVQAPRTQPAPVQPPPPAPQQQVQPGAQSPIQVMTPAMPNPASVAQVESLPRTPQYAASADEMRALAAQAAQLAQRAEAARLASVAAIHALQAAQSAGAAMYGSPASATGSQQAYVAMAAPVPPVAAGGSYGATSYRQPPQQQAYQQPAYQQPVQGQVYQQSVYEQPVYQQRPAQPAYQQAVYTPAAPARARTPVARPSGYHAPLWQESTGS